MKLKKVLKMILKVLGKILLIGLIGWRKQADLLRHQTVPEQAL